MNVLVSRGPLIGGMTAREIVFEADEWHVWEASSAQGAARPLWRGQWAGTVTFIFPDAWTMGEMKSYALQWNKELVDLDLTEPEERVLVGRLPLLVASVPDVETSQTTTPSSTARSVQS